MAVQCANNTNMQSVATVELGIPTLPAQLKTATVFREMTKPLFSIPVVCDDGMEVTFRKNNMIVTNKDHQVILTGTRDTKAPLWLIPIGKPTASHMQQLREQRNTTTAAAQANSAYHQNTIPKLTAYIHDCVGSIPPTTWIKAIDNDWFSTWPGLTATAIRKHLPKSPMTVMGHMHRIRQGIRPTTKITKDNLMQEEMTTEPKKDPPRGNLDCQHYVGINAVKFEDLKGSPDASLSHRPVAMHTFSSYTTLTPTAYSPYPSKTEANTP